MKRKRSDPRRTRQAISLRGNLIRIGRMERGMAAQELADRAGISRTRLHNIEKGAAEPKIGARLFAGRQSRGKVRLGTTI